MHHVSRMCVLRECGSYAIGYACALVYVHEDSQQTDTRILGRRLQVWQALRIRPESTCIRLHCKNHLSFGDAQAHAKTQTQKYTRVLVHIHTHTVDE